MCRALTGLTKQPRTALYPRLLRRSCVRDARLTYFTQMRIHLVDVAEDVDRIMHTYMLFRQALDGGLIFFYQLEGAV